MFSRMNSPHSLIGLFPLPSLLSCRYTSSLKFSIRRKAIRLPSCEVPARSSPERPKTSPFHNYTPWRVVCQVETWAGGALWVCGSVGPWVCGSVGLWVCGSVGRSAGEPCRAPAAGRMLGDPRPWARRPARPSCSESRRCHERQPYSRREFNQIKQLRSARPNGCRAAKDREKSNSV